MVKESTVGLMVEDMKEITKMTRNMVVESIIGQMEGSMTVNGKMASNMDMENIMFVLMSPEMAIGIKVKEPDGLIKSGINSHKHRNTEKKLEFRNNRIIRK